MGAPVTEHKLWALTRMPGPRPGLGARWDGAPRTPGICCLWAGRTAVLQCLQGLCLAFLRHGSSVGRCSGGILGWPLGVDGLDLQPHWLVSSSSAVGTQGTRSSVPRNHTDAEPPWTLFVEPGAQKVIWDENNLGYVFSLSGRRVLPLLEEGGQERGWPPLFCAGSQGPGSAGSLGILFHSPAHKLPAIALPDCPSPSLLKTASLLGLPTEECRITSSIPQD